MYLFSSATLNRIDIYVQRAHNDRMYSGSVSGVLVCCWLLSIPFFPRFFRAREQKKTNVEPGIWDNDTQSLIVYTFFILSSNALLGWAAQRLKQGFVASCRTMWRFSINNINNGNDRKKIHPQVNRQWPGSSPWGAHSLETDIHTLSTILQTALDFLSIAALGAITNLNKWYFHVDWHTFEWISANPITNKWLLVFFFNKNTPSW